MEVTTVLARVPIQPAILRIADLKEYLNLSRSAIQALMSEDPTFPQQIQLSRRAVGWKRPEIDAWIESRPPSMSGAAARDAAAIRSDAAPAGL